MRHFLFILLLPVFLNAQVISITETDGNSFNLNLNEVKFVVDGSGTYTLRYGEPLTKSEVSGSIIDFYNTWCEQFGLFIVSGDSTLINKDFVYRVYDNNSGGSIILTNRFRLSFNTSTSLTDAEIELAGCAVSVDQSYVYVSKSEGNNSFPFVGSRAQPFKDPWAARDAMEQWGTVNGGTIHVLDGRYIWRNVGDAVAADINTSLVSELSFIRNGLTIYNEPGVIYQSSSSSAYGNTILTSYQDSVTFNFLGKADIVLPNSCFAWLKQENIIRIEVNDIDLQSSGGSAMLCDVVQKLEFVANKVRSPGFFCYFDVPVTSASYHFAINEFIFEQQGMFNHGTGELQDSCILNVLINKARVVDPVAFLDRSYRAPWTNSTKTWVINSLVADAGAGVVEFFGELGGPHDQSNTTMNMVINSGYGNFTFTETTAFGTSTGGSVVNLTLRNFEKIGNEPILKFPVSTDIDTKFNVVFDNVTVRDSASLIYWTDTDALDVTVMGNAHFVDNTSIVFNNTGVSKVLKTNGFSSNLSDSNVANFTIQDIGHATGPLIGSGTPVASVVPNYIGQLYLDTATNDTYISHGLTNLDWKKITP